MSFLSPRQWIKHSLILWVALCAACSPTYNWREVRPAELPVAVMLPDKPDALTQRVRLDGLELPMSMSGAKVSEAMFTVACAQLPDDQPATRERVLAAMRAGMVRNIAGVEDKADLVKVRLIDAAGNQTGLLDGRSIRVQGKAQGRAVRMQALFVGLGRRACQAVALGADLPDDEAKVFIDSVRLIAGRD